MEIDNGTEGHVSPGFGPQAIVPAETDSVDY